MFNVINSRIIMYFEQNNCVFVFAVIFMIIIIGTMMMFYKDTDGFTNLKPINIPVLSKKNVIGTCGPGCYYKCKNAKECPNRNIKRCSTNRRIPNYPDNLPVGYGETIAFYDKGNSCVTNVNGVYKLAKNPYGGRSDGQTYGVCVLGSPNPFDVE